MKVARTVWILTKSERIVGDGEEKPGEDLVAAQEAVTAAKEELDNAIKAAKEAKVKEKQAEITVDSIEDKEIEDVDAVKEAEGKELYTQEQKDKDVEEAKKEALKELDEESLEDEAKTLLAAAKADDAEDTAITAALENQQILELVNKVDAVKEAEGKELYTQEQKDKDVEKAKKAAKAAKVKEKQNAITVESITDDEVKEEKEVKAAQEKLTEAEADLKAAQEANKAEDKE